MNLTASRSSQPFSTCWGFHPVRGSHCPILSLHSERETIPGNEPMLISTTAPVTLLCLPPWRLLTSSPTYANLSSPRVAFPCSQFPSHVHPSTSNVTSNIYAISQAGFPPDTPLEALFRLFQLFPEIMSHFPGKVYSMGHLESRGLPEWCIGSLEWHLVYSKYSIPTGSLFF